VLPRGRAASWVCGLPAGCAGPAGCAACRRAGLPGCGRFQRWGGEGELGREGDLQVLEDRILC